ncbi:MAG: sigma-54-dependent Fis family transcriptional regulator [Desulfobulbaceae bacterium]|nr:sigma-54-dependent Fis family transcriptional regulator [Desulfobulbaceae bacterium]
MTKKIMVIDDEKSILDSLEGLLSDEGFKPICVASAEEGLKRIDEGDIDLVLLDIWMPGMDGLEALAEIKKRDPVLPVIMISGHGNIETAVKATKMGAFDFIEKPPSYDKIVVAIANGLKMSKLVEENEILRTSAKKKSGLTGNSKAIQDLCKQIERVAPTTAWVLIRGEHGTGKEVVAQSIHRLSNFSNKPMVELNCAAIPEELIESELFGHEKGSFTSAIKQRKGDFELANGGTLFLDEIGDMSLSAQSKVLRALQENKIMRVGGEKEIPVDARIIAATNKDVHEEIQNNRFREDLYHRISVIIIHVPALRERKDDIPLLADHFMKETCESQGKPVKKFRDEAMQELQKIRWTGNIRELRNVVERLAILCAGEVTGEDVKKYAQPIKK